MNNYKLKVPVFIRQEPEVGHFKCPVCGTLFSVKFSGQSVYNHLFRCCRVGRKVPVVLKPYAIV